MANGIKTEIDFEAAKSIYDVYTGMDCAKLLVAYNFLGFVHYNNSNLDEAKEYLIKGEKEYFKSETQTGQFSQNQLYMALVYVIEKEYESAVYHLDKATTSASKTDDIQLQSSIYQNIGLVKIQMGELEEGEKYLTKAVTKGGLDSLEIGYLYQNLAYLYLMKDDDQKTKHYISKTKKIWDKQNYAKGTYLLSFIESKLAIRNGDFSKALNCLETGRSANGNKDKLLVGENYLIEASIHEKLGNTQSRLSALENAIMESDDLSEEQLKESILDISELQDPSTTNILLTELISKLNTKNQKSKQLNTQRNKNMDTKIAEDKSTIQKQVQSIGLLATFCMLIFSLFMSIRKQKQNILILNENLEFSNQQIENKLSTLEQKNQELRQFAYVASHDLKSPLRTISSFAGLIKRKNNSDSSSEYLDIIISSAKNMTAMISELLKHSTLDEEMNLSAVNLEEMVNETLQTIDHQIKESRAVITVSKSCDQIIQCDKVLFKNVIQNLVSNAIIYCKENEEPEISIFAIKNNKDITITFSDNGIGIEDSYKDKVFEMFTRLKSKDVEGTGIGLASCKKIVANHGGAIEVNSVLGKGSSFVITLPA